MGKLYNTDIVAWAEEQAAFLRRGEWSSLDIANLAQEIEDVGKKRAARTEQPAGRSAEPIAQVAVPAWVARQALAFHHDSSAALDRAQTA